MKSLSAGLGTARTETYAPALLCLVVAVAVFGAGSFAHAQPGQESSPTSTSRAAEGGYRIVEFSRPLPRAPLAAGVESEPAAAAARILEVSFSAGTGAARWYPPRRSIEVAVKFDRAVTVNTAAGIPQIDLALGTRLLGHARYASGSGSAELIFQYVTGDWNQALSDLAVGASSLSLNGGRIDSLGDATAADLAHAAGRLDNVGARPDSAIDNLLVAASGNGAAANRVALPPAVLRTPLPGLNPDDGLARSRRGRGFVGGQGIAPPASGDPGAALASVTVRAQLQGVEPLLDLSLFQQAISGSPWTAPATAAIAFAPGESRRDTESALADVRQYRVTPVQDDETTATSNTLRAAGTGVPDAPHLWAWVEGQTQVRLQWSRGSSANPPVEDHWIEVCDDDDLLDCDDDDWTDLVERHPQAPSTRSNSYTHGGLVAGSTRHYRVSSRNSLGHGAASPIKSATTQSMPTSTDCTGATWSADMTVAEWGLHDDKGYRAHGEAGGGDDEGLLTNYSFTLGRVTYEVNQLWYSPSVFSPTQRRGWIYFPPSYHLALSKFPDEGKLEDLTLYIGGIALPLSGAGYSRQTFGESFRWSTAQISDLERDERPTSMYEGTFSYRVGDTVEVCLTDSAPTVSLILTPNSISEDGDASTVTAMVEQGSESPFEVTVSAAADSPAVAADFTLSANPVLSFAANATESSGTVTITAEDNDVHAPDKTLTVSGELSVGARPTPPGTVKLTIENDDVAPVLSVTVSEAAIVEAGGVSEVVVSTGDSTFAAEQTITLTFTGSAEKDTDYRVSTEQLTLPESEHSVTATVTAEQDTVDEDDETILVSATHAGADVGTQQQITITDDEDEPELSITGPTVEEGDPAEFEVTLDPASGRDVMVSYITEDVTATAGADYDYTALPSTTLTFVAGETARTLTVATADDTLHEQAETFLVTLSSATNATLEGGGNTLAGTGTINDNDVLPEVSIADATAVVEGAPAEFEVSLDVTSGSEVTVTYATGGTDDTAQSPEDYTAVESTTLTFAVGVQVKTITVATRNDDLDEEDGETFTVTLSAPGNAALATDGTTATGTIDDNDDEPKVSIVAEVAADEGEAALFEVTLNAASGQQVTVEYETTDGSAEQPADYARASGTLTFDGGATTQRITVTTEQDALHEVDETYTVTLSDPENATLAADGTTATGKITNEDPTPELSIVAEVAADEGEAALFEVTLNAASGQQVTVEYATTDGSAEQPADYARASGTLTFDGGATTQRITVTTEQDALHEVDETYTVTLSNPENATLAADGTTATGKITNEDPTPELSIVAEVAADEGEAALFEVTLNAASGQQVTVEYETTDGSAEQPADYARASGTLTFDGGATTQRITVTTEQDALHEVDETYTVTLSNPENATLAADGTTATGKITNEDPTPELSIVAEVVADEGEAALFEVTLNAASGQQVTVEYETTDGSAEQPADYARASGTLTFDGGATTQRITVTTEQDALHEVDETYTVTLSDPENATLAADGTTATGKITNEDPTPELSIVAEVAADEGEAALFEVTLNAASGQQVTVEYATTDGSAEQPADYARASGTLTFDGGATTQRITVTTEQDALHEVDETYTVTLSDPENATLAADGTTATGKITNEDPTPELSIVAEVAADEGEAALFEVTLNAASGQQVTVEYETTDGSAEQPADYARASGTLTFDGGATTQRITVTTEQDALHEVDETYTVTLSDPENATLAADGTTATGKITNEDPTPELSIVAEVVADEGEAALFEVTLNAASGQRVTVEYETTDGSAEQPADYARASGTLTFDGGATTQRITVTTEQDALHEVDETYTVTLSDPENATLAADGTTATGKITNEDPTPELSIVAEVVADEGEAALFEVTLNAASGQQVTVEYETADGSAEQPADYARASGTLTFDGGATTQRITVTTEQDALHEVDETYTVTLSDPENATLAADGTTATGKITNEDPTPELSIVAEVVADEGEAALFEVTLNAASGQRVTVEYATTDGSAEQPADYARASGTLTFDGGATTQRITVTTEQDALHEVDETYTVTLSDPENATLAADGTTATGKITNEDPTPELSIVAEVVADEGEAALFEVTLNAASGQRVTVEYETTDGSAEQPADYARASGTLTFDGGATTQRITVTTEQDALHEVDETYTVTLSNPENATLAADGTTATGKITNEDPTPELSIVAEVAADEGEAALFEVTLNAASGQQVTVEYATTDGSAEQPADYARASGTLTFDGGATTQRITVTTEQDALHEVDETYTVTLSDPENATLAADGTTATGKITNEDPTPELSIVAEVVADEGEAALFEVTLNAASGQQVTVEYATTDGSAEQPADYARASGTLTFDGGATTQRITVTTEQDALHEVDETYTVTLSDPENATLAADGTTATGKITNEDPTPKVSIVAEVAADEGEAALFEVTLNAASGQQVTVEYETTDGSAEQPADYARASGTLTFDGGATTQRITVTTEQDALHEVDETYTVTLSDPENATLAADGTTATGKITNEDPTPELSIVAEVVADEGEAALFEVTLNAASGQRVTVEYETTDGSAEQPADYARASGTLTFDGGATTQRITVTTEQDALHEVDETYTVTLSDPENATLAADGTTATGKITNEDPTPELSIVAEVAADEGEAALFEVTLNAASGQQVTVEYETTDGSAEQPADYARASGTLTFDGGATTQRITVTTEQDALHEVDETYTVTLSDPENATLAADGTTATGKITNEDPTPELSIVAEVVADEGEAALFEVTLNAASGQQVTVEYETTDGSAEQPADYARASGTLTFDGGATTQRITVTTEQDALHEADETYTVTLSNPENATLAADGTTATGKITNEDPTPELSIVAEVAADEGEAALFEVTLNAASGQQVTVEYATTDGSAEQPADYARASGTLTFDGGATTQRITVTTEQDALHEVDETYTVTLSDPENATLAADGTTATGKITNEDPTPKVSIVAEVAADEGEAALFEVTLNAASGQQVTVEYATTDGSAEQPADYARASGTLTFDGGAMTQRITVTTEQDALHEVDETYTVTLSNPENATLAADGTTATGKITNEDLTPELSIADRTVDEGKAAEFVVSLNAVSGQQVTVTYGTGDTTDTAEADKDYTATEGTLVFAAGERTKNITVRTEDDEVDEADTETFTVKLSGVVNATLAGSGSELKATGTINDNDTPSVLTLADVKVKEDTAAVFEVRLGAVSERQVTVEYGTGKTGDTAQEPGDYTTAEETLTFVAGETTKNITVTTIDDAVDEADSEQYTMTLSNAVHATLFGEGTTLEATGTIEDNDDPPELTLDDETVTEGTAAEFEVRLGAKSERQVLVTYVTSDDTAQQPEDYAAVNGTLTFDAGKDAKTITVATVHDELDEGNSEQFKVTLSGARNATLPGGEDTLQVSGTITDDDEPPALTVEDATVTEGTAAEFEVRLEAASALQVTVAYRTADDTAVEPGDYTEISGTLTFDAGDETRTVTVATGEDSLNEADETFKVTLSSASNATLDANDADATGTIGDNDELTAAVTADSETGAVAEGESTTFTVTLTGGTSTAQVVVDYSLVGSATVLEDYEAPSGKLTIGSSLTSGQITIETLEDDVLDRDETLTVQLDSDSATSAGTVNVSDATAETTITDSSEVTVSVKAAVFVEDDPNTPEDESQDTSTVAEGEAASFAVELSGAVGVRVEVPYETRDGSALEGADKDYTENRGTLIFGPTETSKTIEIATLNDDLIEANETYTVMLTATSLPDGVSVAKASATGTITDNDELTAAVTADNPTVTEDQSATFTVALTGATSTAAVVVDYSLVGSATEGEDYTAPSGKLTIGASDTSGEIAIKTLEDDVLDRGETLKVRLDEATTDGTATVNTATAETTITDPGSVQVSIQGELVEEGDPLVEVDKSSVEEGESASFVVELSGAVQKTVEVSYATSGGTGDAAATAGTDYTAADVTLTFASKETSKTVAVTTTVDAFNEADETFTVTLTGVTLPEGVSLDEDATAPGTIENDDGLTATVTANAESVPEGNAAEFTVELTGGTSTADVIVSYTWASMGTPGTDYTAPSGLLTITTPDSSGIIAIATKADEVLDPDETLSVTLTDATTAIGTAALGTPKTATTTIAEKGTVIVSVQTEVLDDGNTPEDESAVEEGRPASFVVELSGAVASSVEVAYATSNGTDAGDAVAGTDYTDTSGTLTFDSGESLTQTITVPTEPDTLNEPTEEFTVTLTGPDLPELVSIGTSSAQGTITDNDGLTAAVTTVDIDTSVDEGKTAEFTVTLTGGTSTAEVLVTYTVGGTATAGEDYTAPTELTLTIGTGVATGTISIETLTDTVVAEGNETLEVVLSGATTATGGAAVDADNKTATTEINDITKATVTLEPPSASRTSTASRSSVMVGERSARTISAGNCYPCPVEDSKEMVVPRLWVEGMNPPQDASMADGATATMTYRTSDGTAIAGDDYEAAEANASITLTGKGPGNRISVEPIILTTLPDELNEREETFILTTGAVNIDGSITIGEANFTIIIEDDDPITATMKPTSVSVEEGDTVSFTVRLTGGTSTQPVTVNHRTVEGSATAGADYTTLNGTLTFANDSETRTFTLQTEDDEELEFAETLVVRLAGGESAGEVTADVSTEVTITDNDSISVSLEAPSSPVTEGESASFVVKLSGATRSDLVVSYETSDGTGAAGAEAGQDYNQASGTLTFSASSRLTQTITVATIDDELNEATETFTVTLDQVSLPASVELGVTDAVVEILDNDRLTASVSAEAEIVAEGDSATFTVALSGGTSTGDVVVTYAVGGTATASDDYTAPDGTLTIGMGETSGAITIATKTDEVPESDETLEVTLGSASSVGTVTVDPTPAMTTIIDPPAVTIGNANAAESDGEIVFEVELSASSTRQITVEYRTVDGTATEPEDYVKASGSLTFAAGQTSGSISIRVVDDDLDEADRETFTVRLSDPKYGRLGDTGITATGTIIDDDDPPAISVHDASAKESAGEIAFRVSLDAPSGRPVAVKYRTEEGTAKPGEDYGDTDGTVTLDAGQIAATIRVRLLNDTLEEPDETFTVRLMELENELTHAELADPTATGTIIDDDVSVAQVWLARFGRTVATHVVDAVGERLNEAAGRSSEAAIAGHPLQPAPVPAEWQESTPIPFRTLAGHDLVAGSSFRLASSGDEDEAADGGSKWTGWGRGAVTRLAGKEPKADLLLRGTIATGTAGVDYDWGGVLTGLAMAYTGGGGNFKTDEPYLEPRSGTAESWLLSAHPYARVSVVDGLEVWGLLGYGLGMMTLTEDASVNTDIRMMMGAAGVRGILLTPVANGGFGVAVSSDGFAMRANADAAGHQPAVEADAVRGRLLVEGSYDAQLGDGSVLTPIVEAGMRYDAGHAEEGFGAELGGGVRYVKPEWGLTATANGRFVLAHQDRGFQEWGLRGSLQWSPGAGGLGPSLGVNTSVGTAASGVQRLWSQGATPIPAAPESSAPAGRLDAQLGYGMSVDLLGTNALLMPYAGLTLADGGTQAYRVGGRANLGSSFSLSLEGQRRESSGNAPAHGITLSGSLHW